MPHPVRHHQANLPMTVTVTEVTETEIFQSHTVFDDRRDSTDWRQISCVLTTIACTLAATLPDDRVPPVANFRGV